MSRIVDLSVALENAMPAHKNFPAPIILPFADHAGTRALGFGTADDPFLDSRRSIVRRKLPFRGSPRVSVSSS